MFEKEEDRRMAHILFSIILICWLASLIVLVVDLIWWDKKLVTLLLAGGILQLIPFGLLLQKKLSASSFISVGIYILLTTALATIGHGVRDYVMMIYPIIIMFAGLMSQQRGLFFSTLLTFAAFTWLIFGEINGWYVVQKSFVPGGSDLLISGILITIAAWTVHILVSNMQYGLTQTWRELADRKRMEEALRESHEDFKRYFNMGAVGMAVTTPEKVWIEVNDRLCQIFGYSKDELSKMTWTELTHPDDVDANLELFNQMMAGELDSYQMDKRYIRKDKSVVYTTIFVSCHRGPDGKLRHLLTSVLDITERKRNDKLLEDVNEQLRIRLKEIEQLHEELREQAIRDPLTGLYNRRYMQDVFKQEFSRARRENYPISVIMLDMDGLKSLNDTLGHQIGDRALQALAFQLHNMTRKEDIVCRYGGDEFTVILSKTFPKDAVKRVDEWRISLNKHPLEVEGEKSVLIKFTAGIASFPTHGTSMEEIINYADVALYRAKARGRNCTAVFEKNKE
jgi:diguanylate cyclase (GGDEF)-like protein/PAS domain S-box-containing protein